MGKAQKAEQAKREAAEKARQEAQHKPWYKSLWLPIAGVAAFGVGTFSFAAKKAEESKYGSLFPYKDQLASAMIGQFKNKTYEFETFLSGLNYNNNKFDLKVYIGQPPSITKLPLGELPDELVGYAKEGIEKWKDYFNISYTSNFNEADVKVFTESYALNELQQNGRAIGPDSWTHPLWKRFSHDSEILGHTILLNSHHLDAGFKNPAFIKMVVGHEFGHFPGLNHPDSELYFKILKTGGYTDASQVDNIEIGHIFARLKKQFPTMPQFTIMLADFPLDVKDKELGSLDREAMDETIKLYKQKYPEGKAIKRQPKLESFPSSDILEPFAEPALHNAPQYTLPPVPPSRFR